MAMDKDMVMAMEEDMAMDTAITMVMVMLQLRKRKEDGGDVRERNNTLSHFDRVPCESYNACYGGLLIGFCIK